MPCSGRWSVGSRLSQLSGLSRAKDVCSFAQVMPIHGYGVASPPSGAAISAKFSSASLPGMPRPL